MSTPLESPKLYLVPSLDAGLDHAIAAIQARKSRDPLAPAQLLLPDRATGTFVQRRLGNTLNVRTLTFYSLSRELLNQARQRFRTIDDMAMRRLVHRQLAEMAAADRLSTFAAVWSKPGFIEAIVEWLREMKRQGIDPADFRAHATHSGRAHENQLAALFEEYQAFLQRHRASDTDGALWLAAEALDAESTLFVADRPLIVMAFDQFTPMQMRILDSLKARYSPLQLYLPGSSELPAGSLARSRLDRTRAAFVEFGFEVIETDSSPAHSRPAALLELATSLFESTDLLPPWADGAPVRALEAPSREEEVRWTLRTVKGLLQQGTAPHNIALYAPQPAHYQRSMATVAHEYGLPIEVEQPLLAEPPINALINLLQLPAGFARRQTFDALRSPYVKQKWFDDADISLLDRLTRERPVVGGREQWSFALDPAPMLDVHDDDDRAPASLAATLPAEQLQGLSASLSELFDHLTPPDQGTTRDYVLWIQRALLGIAADDDEEEAAEFIGPLRLSIDSDIDSELDSELDGDSDPGPENDIDPDAQRDEASNLRDHAALRRFLGVLRRLITAGDLLPADDVMVWADFYRLLSESLAPAMLIHDQHPAAVPFQPLSRARMLTADYVFVLGLSEGEFPSAPPSDIFYSAQERDQHPLELMRQTSGDDASLWWQVIINTRRQLTLTRPWLDENGAPWPPSPYWRAVVERMQGEGPLRIAVAEQIRPEAAAGSVEFLTALAAYDAKTAPAGLQEEWRMAAEGRDLFALRNGRQRPGIYEGVLNAPDIVAELAARFGADHVWSASRLNRFNSCPFGFFAETVLKLEPNPDPEEGLDALQRGSLLHKILEDLYRELAARSLAVTPESRKTILALLHEVCARIFRTAPARYGFRKGPLWRHEQAELRRLLESLMIAECEDGDSRFMPYLQEMGFGLGGDRPAAHLAAEGLPPFRLRGLIDRVDRDAQGRLRIVDYKSGSSTYSKRDIELGIALQTALYAQVADQLLSADSGVAASYYLHIPSRKSSGKITFAAEPVAQDPLVQAAIASAAMAAQFVQRGLFPAAPAKPQGDACNPWCRLAPICRLNRRATFKGRRLLEEMSGD